MEKGGKLEKTCRVHIIKLMVIVMTWGSILMEDSGSQSRAETSEASHLREENPGLFSAVPVRCWLEQGERGSWALISLVLWSAVVTSQEGLTTRESCQDQS